MQRILMNFLLDSLYDEASVRDISGVSLSVSGDGSLCALYSSSGNCRRPEYER